MGAQCQRGGHDTLGHPAHGGPEGPLSAIPVHATQGQAVLGSGVLPAGPPQAQAICRANRWVL